MSRNILLIGNEINTGELIRVYLTNQEYRVNVINDGLMALNEWQAVQPSLIILDLELPQNNGLEIIRRIRQVSVVPIMIISANSELISKLRCFDLGADDYLVKPFEPLELTARVNALLRSHNRQVTARHSIVTLPGLFVDLDSYTVKVDGQAIELTKREVELLYLLAANPERVFTRECLLKKLWGYKCAKETRTIDVHIKRLREKVVRPDLPWRINTLWGLGYKFMAESPMAAGL